MLTLSTSSLALFVNGVNMRHDARVSPSPKTSPRTRYHHGDLRNALTGEAVDLARAGGPDAVVLREVARRVGVSPTAAYRHFATHEDLLEQVKQEALARLREFLIEAVSSVPADADPGDVAVERLRAAGNAYVAFARAESGLFDTAFCRTHSDEGGLGPAAGPLGEDEVLFAETEAYRMLGILLDDLVATGRMDPARRPGAEVPAWSAVHGFACLAVDGPLGRGMALEEQRFVQERMIDMVIAGLTIPPGLSVRQTPDGEPATRSGTGSEPALPDESEA
jgi:AcrR family transcriptional regulator